MRESVAAIIRSLLGIRRGIGYNLSRYHPDAAEVSSRVMATKSYTAIVEKEGSGYVALCPELDVASQGDTVESATANLKEAVELFLECADPTEVERRLHTQVFVTRFEAAHG
jgi:predicted RNase H-like HicB family nuclease